MRRRVETTRVTVALVAWEGESASSDGEPSAASANVNNESDRARIAAAALAASTSSNRASNRPHTRRTGAAYGGVVLVCPRASVPPAARGSFHASWSRSQSLACAAACAASSSVSVKDRAKKALLLIRLRPGATRGECSSGGARGINQGNTEAPDTLWWAMRALEPQIGRTGQCLRKCNCEVSFRPRTRPHRQGASAENSMYASLICGIEVEDRRRPPMPRRSRTRARSCGTGGDPRSPVARATARPNKGEKKKKKKRVNLPTTPVRGNVA